jgi:hypothetical protein
MGLLEPLTSTVSTEDVAAGGVEGVFEILHTYGTRLRVISFELGVELGARW